MPRAFLDDTGRKRNEPRFPDDTAESVSSPRFLRMPVGGVEARFGQHPAELGP